MVSVKNIIPNRIRKILGGCRLKNKVLRYLNDSSCEASLNEKSEIRDFLKKNPPSVFLYDFTKKYNAQDICVYSNNDGRKYVLHENKPLYFKKSWSEEQIQSYYNGLLIEQDIDSPHRYETLDFHVEKNDVVVDVGVAEGNFSLSIIEKVKKIYLFEVDEEWIEALNLTFAPYKDKVEIICKYVADIDQDYYTTLDTCLGKDGKKIDVIKADIEGAEISLLKGCHKILSRQEKLKVIMCTYHKPNDAKEINALLKEYGFQTEFSKGYMLFSPNEWPCLRKGLIWGVKM